MSRHPNPKIDLPMVYSKPTATPQGAAHQFGTTTATPTDSPEEPGVWLVHRDADGKDLLAVRLEPAEARRLWALLGGVVL